MTSLDTLAANPALVRDLPPAQLAEVAHAVKLLDAHVSHAVLVATMTRPMLDERDEALTTEQAAVRLGVSPKTLQHRRHRAPYDALVIETGTRSVRWSAKRIAAFLARPPRTERGGEHEGYRMLRG